MIGIFSRLLTILGLAIILGSAASAYAQQPAEPHGNWDNEGFERQNFREELGQIRREHEDIEATHEQWQSRCGGSNAASPSCEQERQAMRERREHLHERIHALHDKVQADRLARQNGDQDFHLSDTAPPRPLSPSGR